MDKTVLKGLLLLGVLGQGLPALVPQIVGPRGYDLIDKVGAPLGARPPQEDEKAQIILAIIDRVQLARAQLSLVEEVVTRTRTLFERQSISRRELDKDELRYTERLARLKEVSDELSDMLGVAGAGEMALAIPLLKALLLRPALPSAQSVNRPTEQDRMNDRLADALLLAARTPEEGLAAHLYKLRKGDLESRVRAASVLGQLRQSALNVLPHLIEALADEEPRVVQEAITSIGLLGPAAESAIPDLERLTEHPDPQIAERAKAALRQVRGNRPGTRS